jgi:hypothetical protein
MGYWGEQFGRTYIELEGKHQAIRIARGLEEAWRNMPLTIGEEQELLGCVLAPSVVSYTFGNGIRLDRKLAETWRFELEPDEIQFIDFLCDYFHNECTEVRIIERSKQEGLGKDAPDAEVYWAGVWGGHALLDYGLLLSKGVSGIQAVIARELEKTTNQDELEWLEGVHIAGDALVVMAERFSEAAAKQAKIMEEGESKDRLRELARICKKVPRYPAETFHEALQSFWLAFLFDGADSPGRFDQYMYPFYRGDIDSYTPYTLCILLIVYSITTLPHLLKMKFQFT